MAHHRKQAEVANVIGVSSAMIHHMEQGVRAQIAHVEAMPGLEIMFGNATAWGATMHAIAWTVGVRRPAIPMTRSFAGFADAHFLNHFCQKEQ